MQKNTSESSPQDASLDAIELSREDVFEELKQEITTRIPDVSVEVGNNGIMELVVSKKGKLYEDEIVRVGKASEVDKSSDKIEVVGDFFMADLSAQDVPLMDNELWNTTKEILEGIQSLEK